MFPLSILVLFILPEIATAPEPEVVIPEAKKLFPNRWDGDKYSNATMMVEGTFPSWIDGYFLCQISASYGSWDKPGHGIEHLFDALSAVASFHLSRGKVTYSARYYPVQGYDIWTYYERNMDQVGVAWPAPFSAINISSIELWSKVPPNQHFFLNPNVDFWKIGPDVVAGTEYYTLGLQFDPESLSDFKPYPFKDENGSLFLDPSIIKMNMPIHPQWDSEGTIWNTVSTFDTKTGKLEQVLFTVQSTGERKVVGKYFWDFYNAELCDPKGSYSGDLSKSPGYMHSITGTEKYVILPVSSSPFISFLCSGPPNIKGGIQYPLEAADIKEVPLRFLIFDKKNQTFLPIITGPKSRLPMHQFNAFEENGLLYADMIAYSDNTASARVEQMTKGRQPSTRINRYQIDLGAHSVVEQSLTSQETYPGDFSQYNHKFDGKPYRYGYLVQNPLSVPSAIVKMDFKDPSESSIKVYQPGPYVTVAEPQFIPRPGYTEEDDGVLIFRGSDVKTDQTLLYLLDAKSMKLLAKATLDGLITPLGLHNQFYFTSSLR